MNQYWIHDGAGNYGIVTGAAERDRYLKLGWATADAPASDGNVYQWLDGIEKPGVVSLASFDALWSHRGWIAGPPPDGVHPFASQPSAEPGGFQTQQARRRRRKEGVIDG